MLDWLKKLTGREPGWRKSPYPAGELEWLAEDFKRLEGRAPGMADRLMTYLALSESPEVLAELASIKEATALIRLWCDVGSFARPKNGGLSRFFAESSIRDLDFHLRLARILQALASTGNVNHECPGLDVAGSWLGVYLWEATRNSRSVYPRKPHPPLLNAQELEQLLERNGDSPSMLVRGALWIEPGGLEGTPYARLFHIISGMNEALVRHAGTVKECLANPDAKLRGQIIDSLVQASFPLAICLKEVVADASGTAKQCREAAQSWLAKERAIAVPAMEQVATSGNADERFAAVKFLGQVQGAGSHEFLKGRASSEKAKKVVDEIQRILNTRSADPAISAQPERVLELPPLSEDLLADRALDESVRRDLQAVIDQSNAEWQANWEKIKHQKWAPKAPSRLDPIVAAGWFRALQDLQAGAPASPQLNKTQPVSKALEGFAGHQAFKLVHALRWSILLRPDLHRGRSYFISHATVPLEKWAARHGAFELRALAALCVRFKLPDEWIGECWLSAGPYLNQGLATVPPALAWSYFAERLGLLRRALGWLPVDPTDSLRGYAQSISKANAWRVLAAFPVPPAPLVEGIWEVALGSSKTERPLAQSALEQANGRDARILTALGSSQMEQRAVAAEWLGRLKVREAIEPLRLACHKEKHELPKVAMLMALERLGVPPDEFLDRKSLQKDAAKLMRKGVPSTLAWFPLYQLPVVRWEDGSGEVPEEVISAWLVQTCKLKSPVPGPLLRRYAAAIKPADREALGQFVLAAWISEDTRVRSRQDCEAQAMQAAQQMMVHAQQYPQYYPNATLENFYTQQMTLLQNQPAGSVIESKGILALAAACATSGVASPVALYLKTWYGQRVHQCKALLQMLAWVEHPSATQTLLAVGTRFRTKSLQEEATRLAQEIAERKGWSLAELADRTIPTAGFDENGTAELDFGPRQFTLRLNADLEIVLMDPEGKPLKALPAPRKEDDEELATTAKKQFAAARKELKQVLDQQRGSFYEAMCLQRTWRFEDWDLYLNRHPIARHLCQRLVWTTVTPEGGVERIFRPLEDGSLTDVEDNTVLLQPDDEVRVAHGVNLSPPMVESWTRHLTDYEVTPLFDQLSRRSPEIAGDKNERTELRDFEGWLVETFKLRGRATKLGYARGSTGDGGWFSEYVKRFPTAGLQAVVEFTGNTLPEENRTCAMLRLCFQRHDGGYGATELPFSRVPDVLLAECWNDFRQMAADGPGFDPEWSQKSAY
ncbi:DUF4132 domain-containing protein [Verrucomicrobium sp. BvORR106]|uniref:DUF4132 domain-containing protein n=1 Tax=Verrucomicrobium sp. BvORR106 TaxID=1403819 RepID=UPI00057012B3|nr:DUF4132 domain-containing protein [Verrucomicrobium sp. BvORR106]